MHELTPDEVREVASNRLEAYLSETELDQSPSFIARLRKAIESGREQDLREALHGHSEEEYTQELDYYR